MTNRNLLGTLMGLSLAVTAGLTAAHGQSGPAAPAGASGPAPAQGQAQGQAPGQAQGQWRVQRGDHVTVRGSVALMSWMVGEKPIELEFEISPRAVRSVKVGGQTVPDSRVQFTTNVVRVFDESGELLSERGLPDVVWTTPQRQARQRLIISNDSVGQLEDSHASPSQRGSLFGSNEPVGGVNRFPRSQMRGDAPAQAEPRRVMLGVTMVAPSTDLAGHLGLAPGSGVMVTGTFPGTPAALAQLKPFDVITAIGETPATEESILRSLAEANPGQELRLRILSGGQQREVVLKLAAFDPTKLPETQVAPMSSNQVLTTRAATEFDIEARRQAELHPSQLSRPFLPGEAGALQDARQAAEDQAERILDFNPLGADSSLSPRLASLEVRLARIEAMLELLSASAGRREGAAPAAAPGGPGGGPRPGSSDLPPIRKGEPTDRSIPR